MAYAIKNIHKLSEPQMDADGMMSMIPLSSRMAKTLFSVGDNTNREQMMASWQSFIHNNQTRRDTSGAVLTCFYL